MFGVGGCRAEDYVVRPEPLAWGLAALMRSDRWGRAEHKLECLRPIARSSLDEARQVLLVNAVETYLQLNAAEEVEYMSLLQQETNTEVRDLELTWYERVEAQGREQGLIQGRQQGFELGRDEGRSDGLRQVLTELMMEKFGPLPGKTPRKLEGIHDADRLLQLSRELLHARSLAELGLG